MTHDRVRIKVRARALLRQADPKPWTVTLIHWFFSADLCALCLLFFLTADAFTGEPAALPLLLTAILVTAAAALFLIVFHAGYVSYTLRLRQTGKGGPMDLISGFFRGGEILALRLSVLLFCVLWAAAGEIAARGILLFLHSDALVWNILLRLVLGGVVLNRQLDYALALRILLAHPEFSYVDAIARSKRMMEGRKMDLLLLLLSFLGWFLLVAGAALLAILPGLLLQSAGAFLPVLPQLPSWFLTPFIAVGCAAAFPLLLWLTGYISVAWSGFYAAASAPPFPGVSPTTADPPSGGKRLK